MGECDKPNERKSAANFCCLVAAWGPDMFCNFYSVKKAREKISTDLGSLEF